MGQWLGADLGVCNCIGKDTRLCSLVCRGGASGLCMWWIGPDIGLARGYYWGRSQHRYDK